LISQAERQLYISVAEEFRRDWSDEWLEQVLRLALEQALPPDAPGQVSLLVTDDATVRELNRVYRGLDEVTDVLSFSATHQGHWEGDEAPPSDGEDDSTEDFPAFVMPPDELPPLGEIIVSYPQTRRQAEALNRPVDRELALLIVHGALHLVGHDHVEPEETARMQAREQAALAALFEAQGESI
jgi:probable rRNA maturation factor